MTPIPHALLASLNAATLYLWGDSDPFANPVLADALCALTSGATIEHFEGFGHTISYDDRVSLRRAEPSSQRSRSGLKLSEDSRGAMTDIRLERFAARFGPDVVLKKSLLRRRRILGRLHRFRGGDGGVGLG